MCTNSRPPAPISAPSVFSTAATVAKGVDGRGEPRREAPWCRITPVGLEGCEAPDRTRLRANRTDSRTEGARDAGMTAPRVAELQACRGPAGGKLRIRVRPEDGRVEFDVVSEVALDARVTRCVLDALRSFSSDHAAVTWWTGETIAPSGYTALLTIEW